MKKLLTAALATGILAATASASMAGEIAVIVKTTNSSFWQNVNLGATSAIEGHPDYTMTFNGPAAESAINDQVALVENAINRGVAGIVLAPSDTEALAPVVKRAFEAGIPVAIIDSALADGNEQYYQTFLSTDNCAAGQNAAAMMLENAGTSGKVAVMSYVAGVGSEIGRVGCFVDYISENSDIEIVGPLYSQSQMAPPLFRVRSRWANLV